MVRSKFECLLLLGLASANGIAKNQPNVNENGAVSFYATGGWTFGLPAVQASVSVPGIGSATSPEKKTLGAPGFGIGIRAWKFLEPFADFTVIDTGKAYAQVGSFRSDAQADTFTFHGGLRLVGGNSKLRPYALFGGGVLHQNLKGTFSVDGQGTPETATGSAGSLMYGAGIRLFAGHKWGSDIGFEGFHVTKPLNGAGQNYSRVHVGIFYQTKSVGE
jgi:hypothetical protein